MEWNTHTDPIDRPTDLTETDEAASRRMIADVAVRVDALEAKVDRLLEFAEKVEKAWATFQARGVFGVFGGFKR